MPNVRLRTIINQDNSTTFQVQFHEGGEWEDLTWDMISDKPFETLDDTVFIVDENGVLTITDVPTVCSWGDVSDKPFIFLDPDDFSVSASGVLSYTGSLDWSDIIGKPFSTLDNNDFEVTAGKLSVRHQTIPNQTWSQIQNKPFTSLDPTNFQVVGGVLYLNLNPEIPTWSNVQNKPFTYLDNDDFAVIGDTLKVKHQTIPDQTWSQIQNKPFESLDANDFSVDQDGKASVNFPTPDWDDVTSKPFETLNGSDFSVDQDGEVSVNFPTPTPDDWDDVTNKPFETLGSDFSVDADGEVSVNFPTPTPDDWDDITNKPFETLNSSDFAVDPDTGELSIIGGGGGNPAWGDVTSKPFETLGSEFYENNNQLRSRKLMYMDTEMDNAHKITTLDEMRTFLKTYVENSINYLAGYIAQPNTGYWGNVAASNELSNSRLLFHKVRMKVANTGDLSDYSDTYDIVLVVTAYQMLGYVYCFVNAYGLPNFDNAFNLININGCIKFYLQTMPSLLWKVSSTNLYQSECSDYFFS